jgi:hypothetical protein
MKLLLIFISICGLVLLTVGCELGNQPVNYAGDILLQEDFNDLGEFSQPEGWDFYDDPEATNGPSSWFISNTWNDFYHMALRQESDIGGGGFGSSTYYGTVALAGDESWTDYSFEVEFFTNDNDGIGFDFRRSESESGGKSYYRLLFMNDSLNGGPFIKLLYYNSLQGQTLVLAQKNDETYEPTVWNRVKITVIGSNIRCDFNGSTVFNINDTNLTHGRIGLFCFCEYGIDFDNVLVTAQDEGNLTGNSPVD